MLAAYVIGQAEPELDRTTVEGEQQVVKQMIERLGAASLGGWGKLVIIPLPVSSPEERLLDSGGASLTVIAWPEEEYARWVKAWNYLAGTILNRLGNLRQFPLGDAPVLKSLYDLAAADRGFESMTAITSLKVAPNIDAGQDAAIELLVELKNKLGPAKTPKKPLVSTTTILTLLFAAAVGGGLLYYYRRKDRRGGLPAPGPMPAPAPTEDIGWY
jgi:hypothetical protein